MTDFIEGAVYVSASERQAYICVGNLLQAATPPTAADYTGFEHAPKDLVMIWKPGDAVIPADNVPTGETTIVHYWNESKPVTHPFGGTLISSKDVPQETVMRIFGSATADEPVVKYDQDGALVYQHPKTRGWFYPTRYNEEPGYYEDELPDEYKGRWRYDRIEGSSRNRWHKVGTDTWYKIPVDERHVGITPLAVRWVGELDE